MNNLKFRNLHDESDYPLLLELNHSSRQADGDDEKLSLEDIAAALSHMDGLTRQQGVIVASIDDFPIGYSRLGWYSSSTATRLYYQISFLRKEYRRYDLWSKIVANNERILQSYADNHPPVLESYFQAWAAGQQKAWASLLESSDYKIVRRYHNMQYEMGDIPSSSIPAGFEIRPVESKHMRDVWDALKEMNAGLFENVKEDWMDEKYAAWLEKPDNNPRCWQVAWKENQLAGMVLAHFDDNDNNEHQSKHGYTEHIYVKPAWRRAGLARALICHALQALKEHGITVAELGVDSENESAAYRLYENLGYKTFSVDTWFRKPMDQL